MPKFHFEIVKDPAEFELTPYLSEGENKLAVRVFRFTSGSCSFSVVREVLLI